MFSIEIIQTLYGYHYWANSRILACSGKLDPGDYFAPTDYSHGSLHSLLFHMLRAEHIWRQLCQAGTLSSPLLQPENYPDLEALTNQWKLEERAMRAFIASLSADQIEGQVQVTKPDGNISPMRMWRMLVHVVLHGMQHSSEAAALLTGYGQSPGDLDFIFYPE